MKKNKKWMKPRHKFFTELLRLVLRPTIKHKYKAEIVPFAQQGNGQYLVLFNHQTGFDQFFVGSAFRGPMYYLTNDDMFTKGFVSKVITWAVKPIPIKKQANDVHAVMNCIKIAKEGGSIAIAPEGNRTYSGKPCNINPAIVKLVRAIKLPIAFFRIEGGYGAQPRWSGRIRKGKMKCYVSRVMDLNEYKDMTDQQLLEVIKQELYVDEGCVDIDFVHNKRAEYIERAYYVCPKCGLTTFTSNGNSFVCNQCGLSAEYAQSKQLLWSDSNIYLPFTTQWYDYQEEFVRGMDYTQYLHKPMYTDRAKLSAVVPYKTKKAVDKQAQIELYGDRIEIKGKLSMVLTFDEISTATCLGKNKLNIYHGGDVWQLKGGKQFNALKYVHMCYHYKNVKKGEQYGQFLGL